MIHNVSRRRFLSDIGKGMVAVAGSGILIPASAAVEQKYSSVNTIDLWPKENDIRQIWIKRKVTGEESIIRYFDGRNIQMNDYKNACNILRDVRGNETVNMDLNLLDLMFVMQKWLVSWGIDRPLIINSGYRNLATNKGTEGSAKNSLHMSGRAADITMAGIPVDYLGRLAAIFKRGGVGFYASNGFVHIDTGSVRYWSGHPKR